MRVTYRGPHTDGVVTEWGSVLPGESLDVPDGTDLGGDFTAASTIPPAGKASKKSKKESN